MIIFLVNIPFVLISGLQNYTFPPTRQKTKHGFASSTSKRRPVRHRMLPSSVCSPSAHSDRPTKETEKHARSLVNYFRKPSSAAVKVVLSKAGKPAPPATHGNASRPSHAIHCV